MGSKTSILKRDELDPDSMNDFILGNSNVGFVKQEYTGKDEDGRRIKVTLQNDHMVIKYHNRNRILYYHHINRWEWSKKSCTLELNNETEIKFYDMDKMFIESLNALCSILATMIPKDRAT